MNEKVLNALKELGIEYKEFEEAGATKTVDDAAKTLNIERGQVAKSILVKPSKKENFAMIIASGDKKISSKKCVPISIVKPALQMQKILSKLQDLLSEEYALSV